MDASASPQVDADFNEVYGFFLKIEDSKFPSSKQRSSVIKYTKLPDFDFDRKVSWPPSTYTLPPRLRRIISVEDQVFPTSRSLCTDIMASSRTMTSNITKRKIVTITEDEENDLHPRSTRSIRRPTAKTSNRSVSTDPKKEKHFTKSTASRLATPKYSKEAKNSPKSSNINSKDGNVVKASPRSKYSNVSQPSISDIYKQAKGKDSVWNTRSTNVSNISISNKNLISSNSEKETNLCKKRDLQHFKSISSISQPAERRVRRSPTQPNVKSKLLKKITSNKPVTVIHVPLDDKYIRQADDFCSTVSETTLEPVPNVLKSEVSTEVERNIGYKDVNIGTDFICSTVEQGTQIDLEEFNTSDSRTESNKRVFDSLKIPNVTLTKDKSECKEEIVKFQSKSLPNLKVPALQVTSAKLEDKTSTESGVYKSYIISRATVTCTTRQKINFEVVGSNEDTSSELSASKLSYPLNVVSVFKKRLRNTESKRVSSKNSYKQRDKSDTEYTNRLNELKSLNCSYVLNSSKLVKPSDIISSIRVNSLLQSDYISEQFQRELNFIDSFFESLQYLESCSFTDKGFSDNKVHSWVQNAGYEVRAPDYGSFLSRLENGANVDDTETMASKSLCLLNLLIRDEQRRAKNLLFVLKMREDALKDFTKSQILWLEDKKKQDNTDISTLKKKQRGALLKLQHECGEMQRMRKALLTLTEKRKVALLKTKKNIELKLSKSLDVDQLLLGKKKLKKGAAYDRNTAPLKCFELSSSGCDDSATSRAKSDVPLSVPAARVTSVEKSIQTGDSILGTSLDTDTAAENFVVVDGGYLNILFHNLALPQIFSCGKQYEVNEEALKNIVNSSNTHHNDLNETDVLEKFMDHVKNSDVECSTPSTARSLVEEMDQYYKDLTEGENNLGDRDSIRVLEMKDSMVQVDYKASVSQCEAQRSPSINASMETVTNVKSVSSGEQCECGLETGPLAGPLTGPLAGPLPVPAGAVACLDPQPAADVPLWLLPTSSTSSLASDSSCSSQPLSMSVMSISGLSSPAQSEAEELRRQQLAIEREIKALEQQQLVVVREIPDKPPPPYTPPTETRLTKIPRMYLADDITSQRVHKYITNPTLGPTDPTDGFDLFVNDFCQEALQRHRLEESDKPWDACNLLPPKPPVDTEKLLRRTSADLVDVFTGVTPTVVSGVVASRRSDHIDDILFAEWRRCEPEWTTLHTDEATVKNQLFESIFQRILTETIDEYKRVVHVNQ